MWVKKWLREFVNNTNLPPEITLQSFPFKPFYIDDVMSSLLKPRTKRIEILHLINSNFTRDISSKQYCKQTFHNNSFLLIDDNLYFFYSEILWYFEQHQYVNTSTSRP